MANANGLDRKRVRQTRCRHVIQMPRIIHRANKWGTVHTNRKRDTSETIEETDGADGGRKRARNRQISRKTKVCVFGGAKEMEKGDGNASRNHQTTTTQKLNSPWKSGNPASKRKKEFPRDDRVAVRNGEMQRRTR